MSASLVEQVGQEILSNLHSDREKIQRARERVSTHIIHYQFFCHDIHHFLFRFIMKHTNESIPLAKRAHTHTLFIVDLFDLGISG